MTQTVQKVELCLDKIPATLKELPCWRPFKLTPPAKVGDKPGKVPLNAHTLRPSNNTRNTKDCTSFELAKASLLNELKRSPEQRQFHGIGMSLTGANDLLVVDLDKVILEDGSIKPHAKEILETIPGFVERSISGTGFHIFTKSADWESGNQSNHELGVEIFREGRYIAITGDEDRSFSKPIPSVSVSAEILKRYLRPNPKQSDFDTYKPADPAWTIERIESELLSFFPSELDYGTWLEIGMALHHQTNGSAEGYECFDRLSSRGTNYPAGNEKTTHDKWCSFGKSSGKDVKTVGTLIHLRQMFEQQRLYQRSTTEPLLSKIGDARKQIKKIDWLVEGMIKQQSLVMFGGMPSGGKTYLAVELMLSVASGKPFLGQHTVKQGDAVFIACEGRDSVLRRVGAWNHLKNGGIDVDAAYISSREIVVTAPEKSDTSIEQYVRAMEAAGIYPRVFFIDTMNYSLGSAKENDANDMTEYFLRIANGLIARFGCTAVLLHHTSKDGADIRGSSTIRGALDSLFLVSRDSAGIFAVKNDKHKDRDKLEPFYLEGRQIEFELPDGSMESNIALYPTEKKVTASGSIYQQKALELLEREVDIGGAMIKKDLLALIDYRTNNAARDIFTPLEEGGFIETNKTQVTLLKTSDFYV
ncbi:AAA family ATPase [Polynucleobacter sp. AP-Reno-20A-A9]|uniref:AAA family ATPase n=1 Tax=Polynucleobacter sp. AP-Reno-20A-A9 TaxID=2576925 RepID=UPI001C0ABCAE|nr:AAA family ATPase [Polynucleobacter sp. AP-Reno-20A-A9]MBU3628909.1 AAA family ATPase [Polynucleobacter sp. AP-Reno-20A-A9]